MAMERILNYDLKAYSGTYISKTNLLSATGKHRFVCAMCYNTVHCRRGHTVGINEQWDSDLYTKVATLVNSMSKCTGIYISSGYRTAGVGGHDKCVGGSGNGPHTLGRAVDICFAKNGGNLNCRQVAVVVKSLGLFNGIAPISDTSSNGYIHLDTKNRKWYGDEYYIGYTGYVTNNDFLTYYRRKGLPGFSTMYEVQTDLGWFDATVPNIPNQIIAGTTQPTPSVSDSSTNITITVKGSTSSNTLKNIRPYFAQYTGSSSVLKSALKELGEASVDWYILSVAQKNGVNGYSGSMTEDAKLMLLLRQGKLIRP